ncbi:uracil-DNA glycosylase family 4 [Kribbella aluminosa]|uniref:Type-5 uracil-DNA glycosylase n=1 Tax=Kribbella aluminosa TaxID=416017 RepID=A0ABS4UEX4_9ACTN|nr:uracil-DNA glycosylase [Kribbella aluminosa]MBP2350163.1 uracil-DNA glycosylase family 4 [Kribbella aluminosa]
MTLRHPLTGELFESPVPAGTGWPEDPAEVGTPVALDAGEVRQLAATDDLGELEARVSVCKACPRLVEWREEVAVGKRKSFADQPYWGRPIPGWGVPDPKILIVGLAPAANGGNRTGRVFTGDRSGDWLFASLNRVGLASRPTSEHAGDGLHLIDTRMIAAVRCAPPANKPTPEERDTCAPWYRRELELVLPGTRSIVCLGKFAYDALLVALIALGADVPRPRPKFGHAVEYRIPTPYGDVTVLGCFHPSQQNTFTGKLTEEMLDAVLTRAKELSTGRPKGS